MYNCTCSECPRVNVHPPTCTYSECPVTTRPCQRSRGSPMTQWKGGQLCGTNTQTLEYLNAGSPKCSGWICRRSSRQRVASFFSESARRLSGTITTWHPAVLVITMTMVVIIMDRFDLLVIVMEMRNTSQLSPPKVHLRKLDNPQDFRQPPWLQPNICE